MKTLSGKIVSFLLLYTLISVANAIPTYTVSWSGGIDFKGWGCEVDYQPSYFCDFADVGDELYGTIEFTNATFGDVNPDANVGDYPIDSMLDFWSWDVTNVTTGDSLGSLSYCVWEDGCSVHVQNGDSDEFLIAEYYEYGSMAVELFVRDLSGALLGNDNIPLGNINLAGLQAEFSVWDELGGFSGDLDSLSITVTPIPGAIWLFASVLVALVSIFRKGVRRA